MKSFSIFILKPNNSAKAPPAIVITYTLSCAPIIIEITLLSVTASRLLKKVLSPPEMAR